MSILKPGNRLGSPPHPRRQRGVAAVISGAFMAAAVSALALAIDVGRLYSAQQRIQTAADIAAIEAARAASGCQGQPADIQAAALAAANTAVGRNFANRDDGQAPMIGASDLVLGGEVDDTNADGERTGLRSFVANNALAGAIPPDEQVENFQNSAVQVTVNDPQDPGFFFPLGQQLSASAAASNIPTAAFQVGSGLLSLEDGLLEQLGFDDAGALDQGALADASIDLGALAVELGVASDDLLTTNLPLQDAITAINTTADDALAGLAGALSTDLAGTGVTLGDVLNSAGPIGENAQVSALALSEALVQLAMANRDEAIDISLPIALPQVGDVTAQVRILEPPVVAVGRPGLNAQNQFRTEARSASVAVQLSVELDIDLGAARIESDLPIFIDAGSGRAGLRNIFCANSNQPFHEVELEARSQTANLGVGRFEDLPNGNRDILEGAALDLVLLPVPILLPGGITLALDAEAGPVNAGTQEEDPLRDDSGRLPQFPPAMGEDNVFELTSGLQPGSAIVDLLGSLDVTVDPDSLVGLGATLGLVVNPTLAALGDLSTPVSNLVSTLVLDDTLNDLLTALGVNLGNAEVTLQTVNANRPQLIAN